MTIQYLEDFLVLWDENAPDLETILSPIIKVSVTRLPEGKASFILLDHGGYSQSVSSIENFGLGGLSHRVEFSLLEMPDLRQLPFFESLLGCPLISGELMQVTLEPFNSIEFGAESIAYNDHNRDCWSGHHFFEDPMWHHTLTYSNPLLQDVTDLDDWAKLSVSWKPDLVFRAALELLLVSKPDLMRPYLAHALSVRLLLRWIACFREFIETRRVFLDYRSEICEIYCTNIGQNISGPISTEKAVDRLAKFLKREAISIAHCKYGGSQAPYYLAIELVEILQRRGVERPVVLGDAQKGASFEKHVADEFRRNGFDVVLTKSSGDYGADIIAEANGIRFAVQCKNTVRHVGLKAVQEAVAARKYYKCDYAVVVGSAEFTAAAKELASENGAILLRSSQLYRLTEFNQTRSEGDHKSRSTDIIDGYFSDEGRTHAG